MPYKKTSKKRCKECGFIVRSKNHNKGEHHVRGKEGKYKP